MAKQIKIKTSPAKVDVNTATSILNRDVLQKEIIIAKKARDLIKPGIKLSFLKQAFKDVEKAFKEAVQIEADKAKKIKNELSALEAKLKEQAVDLVKVTEKQTINQETGEIKRKLIHDLSTKIFSYTPGKKGAVIDTKELLGNPTKYKKFLKPRTTYEVNFEAVNSAKAEELPWTELVTDPKIAFKTVSKVDAKEILKKLKAEEEKEAKAEKEKEAKAKLESKAKNEQ